MSKFVKAAAQHLNKRRVQENDDHDYDNYDDDDRLSATMATLEDDDDGQRDEVKEIQKMTQPDNARVRKLRFAVTISLLVTGAAVTISTLVYLRRAERHDFETAVSEEICAFAPTSA